MLQQTQVKTVIPYYQKFIQHYPDINTLANASVDDVLSLWTGLGYYARARNLHKTAQIIAEKFQGIFPQSLDELIRLPGIGRSTAGAVYSLGMGNFAAILDGNCKRVYARCFKFKGHTSSTQVINKMWGLAEDLTPQEQSANYNQAMMDIGSILCTRGRPICLTSVDVEQSNACPLSKFCLAFKTNSVMEYPEKKKIKKIAEKNAIFLILMDNYKNIYLEQRPPSGIWGSLWCFPQFENQDLMLEWLALRQIEYLVDSEIKSQKHIFSHFRLNYLAYIIKITESPKLQNKVMDMNKNQLFSIESALQLGLATPIKKMLQQLLQKV